MAIEIDLLKAEIARIERELEDARSRLTKLNEKTNGASTVRPFATLRGVLKGKVHFSEDDIASLKIRSRDIA
jgi:predicted  nucleic acid-binding Zn-ribbon protein